MATQKPLVSLSQDTKSQGRHGRKLMEEIMNRPQTPPPIPEVVPLNREIEIQDFPNVFIEGSHGKELRGEETYKPPMPSPIPIPTLVTPLPKPYEVTKKPPFITIRMNNGYYRDVATLHSNEVWCVGCEGCKGCEVCNDDYYYIVDDTVCTNRECGGCKLCFIQATKEEREWKDNEKKREEEMKDAALHTYVPW